MKRLLFSDLPEQAYLDDKVSEIAARLRNGRDCKVDDPLTAITCFNEAHLQAVNLYERIVRRSWQPVLNILKWTIPVGLAVLGVVLTVISLL